MANRESSKRPHERLEVWRDAMDLVEAIYRFSAEFPDSARFALTQQMRRSVVSVPSNIAEGAARRSRIEYKRFVSIARGSLSELDTQRRIAERLHYGVAPPTLVELTDRIFARLTALLNALEKPEAPANGFSDSPLPIPNSRLPNAR